MKSLVFASGLFVSGLSIAAAPHQLDGREWGDIGKADAAGWCAPIKLPKGEDRVLAEYDGMPKGRVKNVTGYVHSEFEFDPADMVVTAYYSDNTEKYKPFQ